MRYGDVRSAGRSKMVPFIDGEDSTERHERRLQVALTNADLARNFAARYGLSVRIMNNGHHWLFEKEANMPPSYLDDFVVEWWPSSAKLVVNKRWPCGIHVHDVAQACDQVRRAMVRHEKGVKADIGVKDTGETLKARVEAAERRQAVLVDALKFYADIENYEDRTIREDGVFKSRTSIIADNGARARAALKSVDGGRVEV